MNLENRYKKILLDIINKKIPNCKVYLFGSRARRDHKSGSDFDLAIDAGKEILLLDILAIQNEIEETNIPVFVDIVDMQTASDQLKEEVKNEGILWRN